MTETPSWLPAIISVDGEWERVVERLYAIFVTDIKKGKPRLNSSSVWWDRRILDGEKYEEGFWHLISKDYDDVKDRLPDFRRAEKLPWCRACIDNFRDASIVFWDYRVKKRIETYIWLKNHDYVVVFKKLNKRFGVVYFLLTAHYVEGESTRKKLLKKYENRPKK
ncbi:MAG: hypothetical protein DDT19_02011 [Syntrophomonadaceae bacterium]|nr:hypothetical protein [Bacillota bacterium]